MNGQQQQHDPKKDSERQTEESKGESEHEASTTSGVF